VTAVKTSNLYVALTGWALYNWKRFPLFSLVNSIATKWWICLPLVARIFRQLLSLTGFHCMDVMSHGQWASMVSAGKFKGPLTCSQETPWQSSFRETVPKCFHVIRHSPVGIERSRFPERSDSNPPFGGGGVDVKRYQLTGRS
jgi:hypothetical protein